MDDESILSLFEQREQSAISEITKKFGRLCHSLGFRILGSRQDTEEVFSEMLFRVWNAIPPAHPVPLAPYLSTVMRRLCFDRLDASHTAKRGSGEVPLAIDELSECVPSPDSVESTVDAAQLEQAVNQFLATLEPQTRIMFLERYYAMKPINEIAQKHGMKLGAAKMSLSRTRSRLKQYLEKEGFL